jgi:hypothetical protein
MLIRLVAEKQSPNVPLLSEAARIANHCQSRFYVHFEESAPAFLPVIRGTIDFDRIPQALHERFGEERAVVFTDFPFSNNWFGRHGSRQSLLSLAGWSTHFAPPSSMVFALHRTAACSLMFSTIATAEDIANLFHDEPVGCAFDFCGDKTDVRRTLFAGYLSPEVRGALRRLSCPDAAISAAEAIFDQVRLEATGRSQARQFDEAFVVMKFSEGDDNDNAYRYAIRPALERFGLRPIRADENPQTKSLSQKVMEHIDRARLVVIKLDEPNPNVFFELGYALAKGKDLLTIIPSDQLAKVPTDIRGWELVTYTAGKFDDLANRVGQYLGNILPHRAGLPPA